MWRFTQLRHAVNRRITTPTQASLLAFPTAYGAGAFATGGRNGSVYHVDTLADSGTGSFREAVSVGNRIIVFDVSGTINLATDLVINNDNLSILGQTAPQGGISITGKNISIRDNDNIIVRYVRFRPTYQPKVNAVDAVFCFNITNLIVDHCSVSWGGDEALSVTGTSNNITIQNTVLAESSTGMLAGDSNDPISTNYSVHNNLFYNISHRFPNVNSIRTDVINNVVHNWYTRLNVVSAHDNIEYNELNNYYQNGVRTNVPASPSFGVNWLDVRNFDVPTSPYENIKIHSDGNILTDYLTEAGDDWTLYRHRFDITDGTYAGTEQWDAANVGFKAAGQYTLLGEVLPIKTAAETLEELPNRSGANKYLNEDGTYGVEVDVIDETYLQNVVADNSETFSFPQDDIPTKQHYIDYLAAVSSTPINTRSGGFYNSSVDIPEVWWLANVPGGDTETDLAPSGYTWREEYFNQVDRPTMGVGFGKFTVGGEGGTTVHVTNRTELVAAVQTVGAVIIEIDNDIDISANEVNLTQSYKTINGNGYTISGDMTIIGSVTEDISDIYINNLAFADAIGIDEDAFSITAWGGRKVENVYFKNCEFLGAYDESFNLRSVGTGTIKNITVDKCLIKNTFGNYGVLQSGGSTGSVTNVTYYYSRFRSNNERNIRMGGNTQSGDGLAFEMVNCYVDNWNWATTVEVGNAFNIIGCYYDSSGSVGQLYLEDINDEGGVLADSKPYLDNNYSAQGYTHDPVYTPYLQSVPFETSGIVAIDPQDIDATKIGFGNEPTVTLGPELYTEVTALATPAYATNDSTGFSEQGDGTKGVETVDLPVGSTYAGKLEGGIGTSNRLEETITGLTIGTVYRFSWSAKTILGTNVAFADSWTGTQAEGGGTANPAPVRAHFTTDWADYSFDLEATATSVLMRFYQNAIKDSNVAITNLSIKEIL